jgi:5-methylcytosine-specific restriction endonuclease McrA|tara:strand:+ start:672 stop:1238 length:567 start_codon:yes stop_codon:yes gene_type:complete
MKPIKTVKGWKKSKRSLFKVIPLKYRKALPKGKIPKNIKPELRRVFEYNPSQLYKLINEKRIRNPYIRRQSINMTSIFPKKKTYCNCGCGKKLTGKQRRWASKECIKFVGLIYGIVAGDSQVLRYLIGSYYGYYCVDCKCNQFKCTLELDHIFPVKWGGGIGWLSNYSFLCTSCHREKTNKDFGFSKK